MQDTRSSVTHEFKIGKENTGYVIVGVHEDGQPGEVFIKMAKEGSTISGLNICHEQYEPGESDGFLFSTFRPFAEGRQNVLLLAVEYDHDVQKSVFQSAELPARFRRHPIDFRELRRQVSILQVLDLIGWKPIRVHGAQLRGPCPIHRSTRNRSRIFSVNVERNIFRCFKCAKAGNQIDLYAAVSGLQLYEAAVELCSRLAIAVPYLSAPDPNTRDVRPQDEEPAE